MTAPHRPTARTRADAVRLRPAAADDEEHLYRVYASTREEELAPLGWAEAQREAFLRMQFTAQDRYYRAQFPDASYQVVLAGQRAAGRLYVDRRPDEIRVLDIALLPEHRGGGIGSALLRDLFDEARGRGVPVRLHVERSNPALRLYRRLGFEPIGERIPYLLLEWRPEGPAPLAEDGLEASSLPVGRDRDQEELERAHAVVLQTVDPLGERGARGTAEDDREGRAPRAGGVAGGELAHLDQLQLDGMGVAEAEPEALVEPLRERLRGEGVEVHGATLREDRR
jgi:ribosomal protein S18 acetylase RimI-like enzyme